MVWNLYKLMARSLVRYAAIACFGPNDAGQLEAQVDKLNRISRILKCIRAYYSLHPKFAADTYGPVEGYLKQHSSELDWALLNKMHVIKPMQSPMHHPSILDIA